MARYAAELGVDPPSPEEVEALLDLAGTAAHASERAAAPLSTWLAGRAGLGVDEARRLAARLAGEAAADGQGTDPGGEH